MCVKIYTEVMLKEVFPIVQCKPPWTAAGYTYINMLLLPLDYVLEMSFRMLSSVLNCVPKTATIVSVIK